MEEDLYEQLPSDASLEQKVDLLLRVNLDKRKLLTGTVKKLENVSVKVESHDQRIESIEKKLGDTVKKLHDVQVTSNLREQSYRLDAVRLTGLPPAPAPWTPFRQNAAGSGVRGGADAQLHQSHRV
jgi:hypothetical protein